MTNFDLKLSPKIVLGVVAVLLVGSLVMDFGVTAPRIEHKHRLEADRDLLRQEFGQVLAAKFRNTDAARALNAPDLQTAIAAPTEDAVSYLGRMIDGSGLMRLNLTNVDSKESTNLVSSEFNVRASGSFDEVVAFVRAVESGSRLAVLENLVVSAVKDGTEVESRFKLTIHDPKGR